MAAPTQFGDFDRFLGQTTVPAGNEKLNDKDETGVALEDKIQKNRPDFYLLPEKAPIRILVDFLD